MLAKLGLFDSCLLGVVVARVVLGIVVILDSLVIMGGLLFFWGRKGDLLGWVCDRVMLSDVVSAWSCCCFSSTGSPWCSCCS